jgi:hypothetical protein
LQHAELAQKIKQKGQGFDWPDQYKKTSAIAAVTHHIP